MKRLLPLVLVLLLEVPTLAAETGAKKAKAVEFRDVIVEYISIDKQGAAFFPPFQEFTYTPKFPVTVYSLRGDLNAGPKTQFSFIGNEFGEQDSSVRLWGRVSNLLFVRGNFRAVPHKIAPGVKTRRTLLDFGGDLYLGRYLVATGGASEENKKGKKTVDLAVGQQEKSLTGAVRGRFNRFGFAADRTEYRFRDSNESHNLRRSTATLLIPGRRLTLNMNLATAEIRPKDVITTLDTLRATSSSVGGIFRVERNTLLTARYSTHKTDNHNADTSSVDGRGWSGGLQYRFGILDLDGSYSSEKRNYTGTDEAGQKLQTAEATGRLHWKEWTLGVKLSRQSRRVSGIDVTNLTDFEELAQKLQVASINVSSTAVKNVYIAYWANRTTIVFDPTTPFGADKHRSLQQNAYVSYYGLPHATFYYNFVDTEYVAHGNQRILEPAPTPVPYELLEDSRFHQVGVDIEAGKRTTCGLSYSYDVSDSGDLFAVNKIKERVYGVSLSHRFKRDFRVYGEFSRGSYKDALGTSVSGHANRGIVQVEKSF